jgi:hypothetical protein
MSSGMLRMVICFVVSSSSGPDMHSFFGNFRGFFFSLGAASSISTAGAATSTSDFERLLFFSGDTDIVAVVALANIFSNELDEHRSTYFLLWFHARIVVMRY